MRSALLAIDLVRHQVLDRVVLVFVLGHLLGDDHLLLAQLGDGQFPRPNAVSRPVDLAVREVHFVAEFVSREAVLEMMERDEDE